MRRALQHRRDIWHAIVRIIVTAGRLDIAHADDF